MRIRSTGFRPIERNGLKGFGITITIDNSNSPDTLPVEADSAGEATSSSRASPAVPFPWRGRGFNPDSVG